MEIKELELKFTDYYKCPKKSCDSIYHISNFYKKEFECRDCKSVSKVPDKAFKDAKKYK